MRRLAALAGRMRRLGGDPRRAAKHLLGRAVYGTGLHAAALRGRALVTCFHSVTEAASPIACTAAEFEGWLDFFAAHFDVISLEALLERLATGADLSRRAVITFDDGYADNHEIAAPALERRGLTACFFVATGFIGSTHQAWWDTDCAIRSRWMSWDQVRDLRARGFEIGAHTRTHADLGAIDHADAMAEIEGSVADIERELGARPRLFAYPFGGAENMTSALRDHVRASGLRCCPSAFGGLVTPATNPYELPRMPITSWYLTPYQLGLEAIRLRDGTFTPHRARSRPDA